MKDLLVLTQEFAALNDAKTRNRGQLAPETENRWKELKGFYDILMRQSGLPQAPRQRFTTVDIRAKVKTRSRLRVQTDVEICVQCRNRYEPARIMDVSCGGALLETKECFGVGTILKLNLDIIERSMTTDTKVAWTVESGLSRGGSRFKTGVKFLKLLESEQKKLDSFIVEVLERQLLSLDPAELDPAFVYREQLAL